MLADQFQIALLVGQLDPDLPDLSRRIAAPGGDFLGRKLPDRRRLVAGQAGQIHTGRTVRLWREVIHDVGKPQQGQFAQHPLRRDLQFRRARPHRRLDRRLHPRPVQHSVRMMRRRPGRIPRPHRRLRSVHIHQILANEHPLARAELAALGHGVPLLVGVG